jgi:hypothetical protein
MSFTIVAATSAGSADGSSVTTAPINTTGADLIVVGASMGVGFLGVVLSDSHSNTWTALTPQSISGATNCLFYCHAPIVGTCHTFTLTGSGNFPSMGVLAVSGSTVSPLEAQSGFSTGSTVATIQPGLLSPVAGGDLFTSSIAGNPAFGLEIDSGFSKSTVDWTAGLYIAGGIAWLIQGSAAAINPSWSCTGTFSGAATTMATFSPAAIPPVGGSSLAAVADYRRCFVASQLAVNPAVLIVACWRRTRPRRR